MTSTVIVHQVFDVQPVRIRIRDRGDSSCSAAAVVATILETESAWHFRSSRDYASQQQLVGWKCGTNESNVKFDDHWQPAFGTSASVHGSSVAHPTEGVKPTWMSKWTSTLKAVGERSPFRARSRPLAPVKIVPFKPPKLYSDPENSDDEYIPRAPTVQRAFPPPPPYEEHCAQDQKIQAAVVTPAPPSESSMAPPPCESRNSERSTGTDGSLDSAQEANELASQLLQQSLNDGVGTEYSSISISPSANEEEQEQPVTCETTESPVPAWTLKWMSRERKADLSSLGSICSDSTLAMIAPLPDEDDPFPDDDASSVSESEFHTASTTADELQACKAKIRSVRLRSRYALTDSECDSAESSSVASMSVLSINDDGESEEPRLGDVSDGYAYLTAAEDLD